LNWIGWKSLRRDDQRNRICPEHEWKAIKELKNDQERVVISADKGDNTVVMNYETELSFNNNIPVIKDPTSYQAKLADRVQQHLRIDYDPAPAHEKALNAALRRMKICKKIPIKHQKKEYILCQS
jgi:hypothetical protein